MDFSFFASSIDGYKMEDFLDMNIPFVSNYLRNSTLDDDDFLFDLILFAFDTKFMKKSYSGAYSELNRGILDNKDLMMRMFKKDYRGLKSLLSRDFSLCSTFKLFSRYKQIYSVDSSFMHDLIATQSSSNSIPRCVFDHLPYDSFYLDLSDTAMKSSRIEGCYIHLRSKDNLQLELIIQLIRKPEQFTGVYTGFFDTTVIPCNLDFNDCVCKDSQYDIGIDHNFNLDYVYDVLYRDYTSKDFNLIFTWFVIIPVLMYLGSYKSDIKSKPITKKERKIVMDNQFTAFNVGFRYGYTIRNQTKLNQIKSNQTKFNQYNLSQSYSTKCSHVRRAHWHTYRYGTGKQLQKLVWMPPILVNGNKSLDFTVHNVK